MMNVIKSAGLFNGLLHSIGQSVVRGGRVRKRGGSVVSFSPQVAELMGSASRAALGGVLALGGVAAASGPALALPCADYVLCIPASTAGLDYGYEFSVVDADGTVSVTTTEDFGFNNLNHATPKSRAIEITSTGSAAFYDTYGAVIEAFQTGLTVKASGAVTINAASIIAAHDGAAISVDVAAGKAGDTQVDLAGRLMSISSALNIFQRNDGYVNVNLSKNSEIFGYIGINSTTLGDGDTTIVSNGNINSNVVGIVGSSNGRGVVSIENNGDITSNINGILANAAIGNYGGIIINNNGSVKTQSQYAIAARGEGYGDVYVVNKGMAHSVPDEIAIGGVLQNNGVGDGLNLSKSGYGNIIVLNSVIDSIDNNGEKIHSSILGMSNGIKSFHNGVGDIDITNQDFVISFFGDGINVTHNGDGNSVIKNSGTIGSMGNLMGYETHLNSSGIYLGRNIYNVPNSGNEQRPGGDLTVFSDGVINGYKVGIQAHSRDIGAISVTNEGTISTSDAGIRVLHEGVGAVTLANGVDARILSAWGILGSQHGRGDLSLSNAGVVQVRHGGLWGDMATGTVGDLRIDVATNGSVQNQSTNTTHNYAALSAGHNGLGAIDITSDGLIEAYGLGISALHMNEGDITITSTGAVTSYNAGGIFAEHLGEGNITLKAGVVFGGGNSVNGENWAAITTRHSGDNTTSITTTSIVEGERSAIYAVGDAGTISIANMEFGYLINRAGSAASLVVDTRNAALPGGSYADVTDANVIFNNAGWLKGTVAFGKGDVNFTNTGEWSTVGGENYFGSGSAVVTVEGSWWAKDSTTHFGKTGYEEAAASFRTGFRSLAAPASNQLIIAKDAAVFAENATFTGLDLLTVNGTLSLADMTVGQSVTTDHDVVFNPGSFFAIDIGPNGTSDKLVAGGKVTINGGMLFMNPTQALEDTIGSSYRVIEADTVTGAFDNVTVSTTAFLGWDIGYTGGGVDVTFAQQRDLAEAGTTQNQKAIANALDSVPFSNALRQKALKLRSDFAASAAFEQLSGEFHPAVRTAMAADSRLSRNAVLERLQTAENGAVWGQGFWNSGNDDAQKSGNTARVDRQTWGFLAGADLPLGENLVLGVAGSYLSNDMKQAERSASGTLETIHALGYIGAQAGAVKLKGGVGYAWGNVETSRSVAFGTFRDTLKAAYDAKLLQAFAEASLRLDLTEGYFEPMASVAFLSAKNDAFTESGGLAALSAGKETDKTTLSTVGSRFSTPVGRSLSFRGMMAWQHAYGSLAPATRLRFAGGESFSVAGVRQSRDAAVVNIEANLALGDHATLGLGYDGVVGNYNQDHAAKVTLRIGF